MQSIRVVLVQERIPNYRIPLFEGLAQLPGIDLTVLADLVTPNALNHYNDQVRFHAAHLPTCHCGPMALWPRLTDKLAHLRPHVAILQGDPRNATLIPTLRWCKRGRIATAVWGMFYRIGRRRWISEYQMTRMGAVADLVLSYGDRGRREQLSRGTQPGKVVVLHNAINERPIVNIRTHLTPADIADFRQRHGLGEKRVILHVVTLKAIKRPELTLEAFRRVLGRRRDVVLVFIGGGELEPKLRRRVSELQLERDVRFEGPLYDERELGLWYRSAEVFVMATCIGLSVHHAMCYGVPVVTDDNPRTQTAEFEALVDGKTGLTYRAGNIADYSEKILRVLDDSELRTRLSQGSIQRIEQVCNFERFLRNFHTAITRLASVFTAERRLTV